MSELNIQELFDELPKMIEQRTKFPDQLLPRASKLDELFSEDVW